MLRRFPVRFEEEDKMADITGKDISVKGVNSVNYVRSFAFRADGKENSEILGTGTHDLFKIPGGHYLTGLKVVSLGATTSSGSATVQFKVKIGTDSEAVADATGKTDLQAGDSLILPVTGIKSYSGEGDLTIQLVVGTADLTVLDLLIIAETIPVTEFITAG